MLLQIYAILFDTVMSPSKGPPLWTSILRTAIFVLLNINEDSHNNVSRYIMGHQQAHTSLHFIHFFRSQFLLLSIFSDTLSLIKLFIMADRVFCDIKATSKSKARFMVDMISVNLSQYDVKCYWGHVSARTIVNLSLTIRLHWDT